MKIHPTGRNMAAAALLALCGGLLLFWLAGGTPAQAQAPGPVYADLSENDWHYEYVAALKGMGVFEDTECEEGFCPGEPLKRWQMAVWLVRILDGKEPAAIERSRFADVGDYAEWAHFIERLAELEVTVGCRKDPPGYCPERAVNRSQMAAFLYRAFGLPDAPKPAGFTDVPEESWAFGYINALAASEITVGCKAEPFSYCPERPVTRAQMAAFLYRALEWRKENGVATGYDPDAFYTERNRLSVLIKEEIVDKHAEDNPWLLKVWNHTNRPDFQYLFGDNHRRATVFSVIYSRHSGETLNKLAASRMTTIPEDLDQPLAWGTLIHEMAHIYTLADVPAGRPGALAAAHLYFAVLGNGGGSPCKSSELYADAVTLLVPVGITLPAYWHACGQVPSEVTPEAETVVRSAFSGEMPEWFRDNFQNADGSWDHEAIWTLVKDLDLAYVERVAIVYQLKDEFGGYCSDQAARDSAFYGSELDQPWRDGGCPDTD